LLDLVGSARRSLATWRWPLGDASLVVSPAGRVMADGELSSDDAAALALLAPLALPGRLVIAQLGQSLDGRIATASGDSYYINGQPSRAHLHRLRALVDAVVIGVGTADADQPALTVRHVTGPDPLPVILDPRARVRPHGPLFEADHERELLILTGPCARPQSWPSRVTRICLPVTASGFDPGEIINALAERGLNRVLIEGGGQTVSRFIDAGALDRLHLLIAPLLIGSGPAGIDLAPVERLAEAQRPPMASYELGGELVVDVCFEGRVRSATRAPGSAPSSTTSP